MGYESSPHEIRFAESPSYKGRILHAIHQLVFFVVVIGIGSAAEAQDSHEPAPHQDYNEGFAPGYHPGEMEPSVDIIDEFRSSIRESFERAAQDIGENFGHIVEEHINAAVRRQWKKRGGKQTSSAWN